MYAAGPPDTHCQNPQRETVISNQELLATGPIEDVPSPEHRWGKASLLSKLFSALTK